jgi:hypothetical protein
MHNKQSVRTSYENGGATMIMIHLAAYFAGGLFLINAVPHFVSGVMGRPFQSPFATPPGRGLSSSTVNVLWGFLNGVIGYLLICRVGWFDLRSYSDAAAMAAGMLVMGLMLARVFGQLHGGNMPATATMGKDTSLTSNAGAP